MRGVAGADLTCEMAMLIGRGAAAMLTSNTVTSPRILIGKDTRQSGDMLTALTTGLCSVGADVEPGRRPHSCVVAIWCASTVPTPAWSSRRLTAMEFNGIKSSPAPATKLPDEVENKWKSTSTIGARASSCTAMWAA